MPIIDAFQGYSQGLQSPITHALAITPTDSGGLEQVTRALYVGTGGNVRVTLNNGGTLTFVNMVQGWHPLRVRRVWATGTTADHLVGCW